MSKPIIPMRVFVKDVSQSHAVELSSCTAGAAFNTTNLRPRSGSQSGQAVCKLGIRLGYSRTFQIRGDPNLRTYRKHRPVTRRTLSTVAITVLAVLGLTGCSIGAITDLIQGKEDVFSISVGDCFNDDTAAVE